MSGTLDARIQRCLRDAAARRLVERRIAVFLAHFRNCNENTDRFVADPCHIDRVIVDLGKMLPLIPRTAWPEFHAAANEIMTIASATRPVRAWMGALLGAGERQRGFC